MRCARRSRGFSLVELLLVVLAVALLAMLRSGEFGDYTARAQAVEAITLTGNIREKVVAYYAHHGRMPANNRQAGVLEPQQVGGRYVESVRIVDGAIHARFRSSAAPEIAGRVVTVRPT